MLGGRGWREGATSDNSAGNGRVLPCQPDRYADPRGTAAWVRTFRTTGTKPVRRAVQFAEASVSERNATRTYRRALSWFTACPTPDDDSSAVPRIQLVSTADLTGVGDQASLVVLRSRADRTVYVVGVARTGLFTTTTSLAAKVPAGQADRKRVARLVATAVGQLCSLDDGGTCATAKPKVADRAAYPIGKTPWLLSEVDLPPLNTDQGPWVGTPPAALAEDRIDSGAIGCDTLQPRNDRGQKVQGNRFRTFVLSGADPRRPRSA